jgi:hypothetical protein
VKAVKAEHLESEQGTSLSKYFGQPDNTDDIFDKIVKPSRSFMMSQRQICFLKPSFNTTKIAKNN